MVMCKPAENAMDMLARWPQRDSMTTPEIVQITRKDWSTIYRWMMRLATYGYFTRRSDPRHTGQGGGTIITWTITPKGRIIAQQEENV